MNAVDRERLQFALEILEREPDAHRILADFLEEHGDVGHAQWARSRKSKSRKRLEFAISLLPAADAVRLGCGFVARVIDKRRDSLHDSQRVIQALSALRSFDYNDLESHPDIASQAELISSAHFLWFHDLGPDRYSRELRDSALRACSRLTDAVFELLESATFIADGETRCAQHRDDQCRHAIRNVARHCREATAPHPSSVKAEERRWQMERTKSVIEELLNATE